MIAVAVPSLAGTEAVTALAYEHLVEVTVGLEILRVVGTRRWLWLAVPIASSTLQIASFTAGIFFLIIILFTQCVLPFVMGTLGPPSTLRPLGLGQHRGWRILGDAVVAFSTLALVSGIVLAFADAFGLWHALISEVPNAFDMLSILSFGPLLLAWCLLLIYHLTTHRWVSFLVSLLAALAYLPAAVLMVQANIFPVFLSVFGIVSLGLGWWIARQPATQPQTAIPTQSLARAMRL